MANYQLNEEKMFADITDNIAIIINSETGIYYGMNEFGTTVFENIISGVSAQAVLEAVKALPQAPADLELKLNIFIKALVDSEIIIEGESGNAAANINTDAAKDNSFIPEVREYNDAQELLLADPIHEVKEDTGWLPDKSARNPDEEDVIRRKGKMEG